MTSRRPPPLRAPPLALPLAPPLLLAAPLLLAVLPLAVLPLAVLPLADVPVLAATISTLTSPVALEATAGASPTVAPRSHYDLRDRRAAAGQSARPAPARPAQLTRSP